MNVKMRLYEEVAVSTALYWLKHGEYGSKVEEKIKYNGDEVVRVEQSRVC